MGLGADGFAMLEPRGIHGSRNRDRVVAPAAALTGPAELPLRHFVRPELLASAMDLMAASSLAVKMPLW